MNGAENAKKILSSIARVLLWEKRYKLLFPHVKPSRLRFWTKERIYVERSKVYKDPTVEVYGILSSGAGGRCDILIADDIIDNRLVATPGLKRKVRSAFFDVFMNMLEVRGSQVVYIGTRWDSDDLTSELLNNTAFEFRKMYVVNETFDPLWPQVWTREELYRRWKQDPYSFDKAFRQRPVSSETMFPYELFVVHSKWLLGTHPDPPEFAGVDPSRIRAYTGVDLSSGHGRDYTVIFTIKVDTTTKKRWPVEIIRMRAPAPEIARAVLRTYETWKPEVVMVESNASQRMLLDWIGEFKTLPIKPYFTTDKKKYSLTSGIQSLRVELENKMWILPSWEHVPDCDCPWCEWRREVLAFPNSPRDDCVIGWWLAREAYRIYGAGKQVLGTRSLRSIEFRSVRGSKWSN